MSVAEVCHSLLLDGLRDEIGNASSLQVSEVGSRLLKVTVYLENVQNPAN